MPDHELSLGFIPLIDASILIATHEMGFAENNNLRLHLQRETSWANIRDRLAIGQFDGAHMLAPMPIATSLGLTPLDHQIVVPMALGLGGNAVTVSRALFEKMADAPFRDAATAGGALKLIAEDRQENGSARLRLGVVHPFSSHNLELRYWLAACGIAPDQDVEIVILPPTLMSEALKAGRIDGYCVGEPWNMVSAVEGHGKLLVSKEQIWASSPEKVLGLSSDALINKSEAVNALLRSCYQAAQWCGNANNMDVLVDLLSSDKYLAVGSQVLHDALTGVAAYEPFAKAATFPWKSHALWFYSQMVRWGMLDHSTENAQKAAATYAPDIYRDALDEIGAIIPTASLKVEGALTEPEYGGATNGRLLLGPDGFFDGRQFDPDDIDTYITDQAT